MNGQDKADLRYLSTLVGDARTHLEAAPVRAGDRHGVDGDHARPPE
jgi:hypothetical protein